MSTYIRALFCIKSEAHLNKKTVRYYLIALLNLLYLPEWFNYSKLIATQRRRLRCHFHSKSCLRHL